MRIWTVEKMALQRTGIEQTSKMQFNVPLKFNLTYKWNLVKYIVSSVR